MAVLPDQERAEQLGTSRAGSLSAKHVEAKNNFSRLRFASRISAEKAASVEKAPEIVARTEVQKYLEACAEHAQKSASEREDTSRGTGVSPSLRWWALHETTYPHVARLARKYLCVSATSVPSERVFSKAGDIVSNERARMSPSLVEALVIAKDNFEFARRLQGVENSELVE